MRAAFCCLVLALLGTASAERWTIQVFAYGSAARAAVVAERLRGVGYDAYTGALSDSLVGVRIGCFSAQTDAEGLAQDVRRRVALDALVVPFQEGAGVTVCVEHEVGFVPPAAWGLESQSSTQVTFWVEAAGRRYISFNGESWTLIQAVSDDSFGGSGSTDPLTDPLSTPPPTGLPATFRVTSSRGLPLVRADLGGGSLLVAAGSLLWRSARAVVVQRGSDVFALRLMKP